MKRLLKVYKKTTSIIDEKATDLYENLVGGGKGFLLESYDKNYDMFTIFGAEPDEIITSADNALIIRRADGSEELREGNPHKLLKEYYDEFEIRKDNNEIAFSGGLVGNLGYDYIRYTEDLPNDNPDDIGIATIQMMLMTRFLVLDNIAETLTAVVLEEDSDKGRERAMRTAEGLLSGALKGRDCHDAEGADHDAGGRSDFVPDGKIVHKTDTLEEYSEKVEKIKHYIREGHVFQTVLSQRWTVETAQDGFTLYRHLRELNPSPYLYYFNYGDFEVIGSSPEMIVKQ